MTEKQIYILIGQKGSGKSFIGTLFNKYFNIDFVRVEDWILDLKNGRDIYDEEYLKEAFQTIESLVRKALSETDSLVFESTGLTEHFDKMLTNLQLDYIVKTIKINTDTEVCLDRIQNRDQSIHINFSNDLVKELNESIISKNLNTDYIIENNNKPADDLKDEIGRIIESTAPKTRYMQ